MAVAVEMSRRLTPPGRGERAISVRVDSWNEEERTVDVVWSTGARITRAGWFEDAWDEELDLAGAVLDRLNSGRAPLLDAHNGWTNRAVIGVVVEGSAVVEDGEGRARVRLSDLPDDAPIVDKIRTGIVRNTSIGYDVARWEQVKPGDRDDNVDRDLWIARSWEPFEISAVPMGADPAARFRGQEGRDVSTPAPNPTPASSPVPVDLDAVRVAAASAERARIAGIRSAARVLRSADDLVEGLVADPSASLDAARARLLNAAAERDAATRVGSQVSIDPIAGGDALDKRARAWGAALRLRAEHGRKFSDEDVEAARAARGLSVVEMCREYLELVGVRTAGMSRDEVARRALLGRAAPHSTSDFPVILGNIINTSLVDAYREAPQTFREWTRQTSFRDLRAKRLAKMSAVPNLILVGEGEEYERITATESLEQITPLKRGLIFAYTWEMAINDDLDMLGRLPAAFGRAALRSEEAIVYALLTANPAMGEDAVALFAAGHNNLAADVGAPTTARVDELRALLALQTSPVSGTDVVDLDIGLRFLLVPTGLGLAATRAIGSGYTPTVQAEAIPEWFRSIVVIEVPRLRRNSAVLWYGAADWRDGVDTIEYGYLDGNEGLVSETRTGFDVDGVEVKVRHVFGAGLVDFRGLVRNAGA